MKRYTITKIMGHLYVVYYDCKQTYSLWKHVPNTQRSSLGNVFIRKW